ncbi:aminoglycoside N(3)-acetyltransferase [Shewanella sp. FDAARGOS_354]|nr:aminoglycoside N(3)-acetyltransferase [Shewanella sp. FDAARGOS_354]
MTLSLRITCRISRIKMRLFVRSILAKFISESTKKKLKKWEFKARQKLVRTLPELTEDDLRELLEKQLKIKKGDNLFVHASLSLLNTKLSSEQVYNIIRDIVGENGSISVPCFPRMSSKQFMCSNKKFDVKFTPSGMGEFSEYVRKRKDAIRSFHPTKSIASVGLSAEVLSGHHECDYPFGKGSPYHKLLELNPKVIGIGVPMSYLSFVHIAEDMNPESYPLQVNESKKITKMCVNEYGEDVFVESFVHDMNVVVKANPEKYVRNNLNSDCWVLTRWYLSPFFIVDGAKLTKQIEVDFKNGITVYK